MALTVFAGKTIADLVLTHSPRTCLASTPISAAIGILQENRIGSVVVIDDKKKPIGIFTERDLLMKFHGKTTVRMTDPVEKFMTPAPKCLLKKDRIEKAIVSMRIGGFRHIVITDEEGFLADVLSVKDILDFMVDNIVDKKFTD